MTIRPWDYLISLVCDTLLSNLYKLSLFKISSSLDPYRLGRGNKISTPLIPSLQELPRLCLDLASDDESLILNYKTSEKATEDYTQRNTWCQTVLNKNYCPIDR